MPDKRTIEKARKDKRAGKSPSTQAGEFVHEEIDKVRQGKHGVRSSKQAIAIGLSKARRAGVDLPPPRKGSVKARTRKSAQYAYEAGQGKRKPKRRPRVSRAVETALKTGGGSSSSPPCALRLFGRLRPWSLPPSWPLPTDWPRSCVRLRYAPGATTPGGTRPASAHA